MPHQGEPRYTRMKSAMVHQLEEALLPPTRGPPSSISVALFFAVPYCRLWTPDFGLPSSPLNSPGLSVWMNSSVQTLMSGPLGSVALLLLISLGTLSSGLVPCPCPGTMSLATRGSPKRCVSGEVGYAGELGGRRSLEKPPLYYWITTPFYSPCSAPTRSLRGLGPPSARLFRRFFRFLAWMETMDRLAGACWRIRFF